MDLTAGSAFLSLSIALKQASTFVDVRHFLKSIFCKIEALPNLLPLPSLFTRATRLIGSRQTGQLKSRFFSWSTHEAQAQTWPQLNSIVSRGASRQTTQTSRVAASTLFSSCVCCGNASRSNASSSSLSLSRASAGNGSDFFSPSVFRPLSMVACFCFLRGFALGFSPSSTSSSATPWTLDTCNVRGWKHVGHSGASPRWFASSTIWAAQSRWNVCRQAATAQSAASWICALQQAHKS
mmetsp:Transcript_19804/g.56245  ORF Transcript_19804/g.56245 Transcript_19804/m.56245 type:complete len:238 (-) Transcript_19804:1216-1929(-)